MPQRRPWCAFARRAGLGFALAGMLTALTVELRAQDPFEIHVLEYEQLKPGEFTFENHTNYVPKGSTSAMRDVVHLTYELTAGIIDNVSFGVMQLNARRPETSLESVGWRLVPHLYAPQSWHLPIDIGLVTELTFQNTKWEPNSRTIEIVPILEKRFRLARDRELHIDLNPSAGRALHGPDIHRGWDFGLAARAALEMRGKFAPSLEYYSDWGRIANLSPLREQAQEILPGGDFRISKHILWSVGVGVGLTPATNRLVYKSRVELSFGRHTKQ
jgi:hypothetical protein